MVYELLLKPVIICEWNEKKLLKYKSEISKLDIWSHRGLVRRLQEGLSTRRSQQELVARTAKLEVLHGGSHSGVCRYGIMC